jgi:hypothetical protein
MNVNFIGTPGIDRLEAQGRIPEIGKAADGKGMAEIAATLHRDIDRAWKGRAAAGPVDGMDVMTAGSPAPKPAAVIDFIVSGGVRMHENKDRTKLVIRQAFSCISNSRS